MRNTVDQCPADIVLAPTGSDLDYADDIVKFAEGTTGRKLLRWLLNYLWLERDVTISRIWDSNDWIDSVQALAEGRGWAELLLTTIHLDEDAINCVRR
ncbi:hypothetical protein RB195_012524 [Necator americanus]|uniref:Uncharacterized protein n=1 Tax=Necator americanus TaxID=51031 RepID=A0ABR1D8Q1_NECAM